MLSNNAKGILAVVCAILMIGAGTSSVAAMTSPSLDNSELVDSSAESTVDLRETTGQNETSSQQSGSIEAAARQGVEEGIGYLEGAGVPVSEEHREAALNGAVDAANDLEQREEVEINTEHVRQSAYGSSIGALQRTTKQSPIATADAPETTIDPNTTYEITFGATFGASVAAAATKSAPGDVPPAAVVDAAYGAAAGTTLGALDDSDVAAYSGEVAMGAAAGALRGARGASGGQIDPSGGMVIFDPQPYISLSAEGAARGALRGVGDRQQAGQSPSELEVVTAASDAAMTAVLQATGNSWPPDQAYSHAYDTSSQSIVEGR